MKTDCPRTPQRIVEESFFGIAMIDLHHKIEIPVAPQRVWKALLDFPNYPKWNPFVAVRGIAGNGNRIEWSFGRPGANRKVWQAGLITAWDEPRILTWRIGSRIFRLDESYSLEAKHSGTVLRHSIRCRGLLVALLGPLIRRRLKTVLSASDHGLHHYLKPTDTAPMRHAKHIGARRVTKKRRRPRVR